MNKFVYKIIIKISFYVHRQGARQRDQLHVLRSEIL